MQNAIAKVDIDDYSVAKVSVIKAIFIERDRGCSWAPFRNHRDLQHAFARRVMFNSRQDSRLLRLVYTGLDAIGMFNLFAIRYITAVRL